MAKPYIYVSDKKIEFNGIRADIMTYLTFMFEQLVESGITTKEELHSAVDMAFMNDEELKKLAEENMKKILDNLKELLGEKNNE